MALITSLTSSLESISLHWFAGRLGEGFFQGLPISLNGVQKVLDFMDWQDGEVRVFVSNPIRSKETQSRPCRRNP